jgi:putative GTP pyrophosphokinase
MKFEIQLRTVLQHAWAELAHDRSFKFSPGLPQNIQRKLNLYSGMLEVVDSAFDSIAKDIEDYKHNLSMLSPSEIEEEELNRLSLDIIIQEVVNKNELKIKDTKTDGIILNELRRFGILKINDLSKILTDEFFLDYKKLASQTTVIGFIRDLMMFSDIDKYF